MGPNQLSSSVYEHIIKCVAFMELPLSTQFLLKEVKGWDVTKKINFVCFSFQWAPSQQDQSLEQVWSKTLPKQTPVLNLHCELQDYPSHSFNILTVLQCSVERHGIMNFWISSRRALLSPLKINEWASQGTNSNTGGLLKQGYVQSLSSPTPTTSDFTAIDGKVVFRYKTWQRKSSQNRWIYTVTLMNI